MPETRRRDYGAPMHAHDAAEGAKYHRIPGKTPDGKPKGFCKVFTAEPVDNRAYMGIEPTFEGNPLSLEHFEAHTRYLKTLQRIDPRAMPEEWQRALVWRTIGIYDDIDQPQRAGEI